MFYVFSCFSLIFDFNVTARVLCVFVFFSSIGELTLLVPPCVFFVFLCFFPRQGFFPQNLSVMGGCTHSVLKGGMSEFFLILQKLMNQSCPVG